MKFVGQIAESKVNAKTRSRRSLTFEVVEVDFALIRLLVQIDRNLQVELGPIQRGKGPHNTSKQLAASCKKSTCNGGRNTDQARNLGLIQGLPTPCISDSQQEL